MIYFRLPSTFVVLLLAAFTTSINAGICHFYHRQNSAYGCRLENAAFLNPFDTFVIGGSHPIGRGDHDVTFVETENSVLNFFPQEILNRFSNLEILEIKDADLRQLILPWQNCANLRTILFQNNSITMIPDFIFERCNGVMMISFTECRIHTITPLAFNGLRNVMIFDLQNNLVPIASLGPFILSQMPSLQVLRLEGALFGSVHQEAFRGLVNLTTIYLGSNNMTVIEQGTFTNLPSLQFIFMENSRELALIQTLAFDSLPRLQTLDLRNGILTILNTNSFGVLPGLRTLHIHNQRLTKIPRNFFTNFPNIWLINAINNVCINSNINTQQDANFLQHFEECFWRFEGQPSTTTTTTTLGASTVQLSFALFVSMFTLSWLKFWYD